MRFQTPLVPARLVRRYKRFLADCTLAGGEEVTAHVANPGAMTGLAEPGTRVWLRATPGGGRKLAWSWCLAETPSGALVCVDTGMANRVVAEALAARAVPALAPYDTVRAEVRYDGTSRVDFVAQGAGLPDFYLEVKSVTLSRQDGLAEFPDTRTARGTRHLQALARMVAEGHRAATLYLAMRSDADAVALAGDIDPAYAAAADAARAAGVGALALSVTLAPDGIAHGPALPIRR